MNDKFVDWKRVGIFIAFAFGIAWVDHLLKRDALKPYEGA